MTNFHPFGTFFPALVFLFLVQPHFHVAGAGAKNELPLGAKLLKFQAGNSDILN